MPPKLPKRIILSVPIPTSLKCYVWVLVFVVRDPRNGVIASAVSGKLTVTLLSKVEWLFKSCYVMRPEYIVPGSGYRPRRKNPGLPARELPVAPLELGPHKRVVEHATFAECLDCRKCGGRVALSWAD
eukprot:4879426-Amphidinium_carterae.1